MIHLIINDIPPSNNKYQGKGGMGKNFAYQADKKKWLELMSVGFHQTKQTIPNKILERLPLGKALLHITYYFPDKRKRDPDNYSGKFLADSLVHLGILKDDSFANITLKLEGDYDKENPRTEIRVMRLEGGR